MTQAPHNDWPDVFGQIYRGWRSGNLAYEAAELVGNALVDVERRGGAVPPFVPGWRPASGPVARFGTMPMDQWPTPTLSAPSMHTNDACLAVGMLCSNWRHLALQIPRLLHPFTAIPANRTREPSQWDAG